MSEEQLHSVPPDETGTDVLNRYRYQAHVAFPYCLQCCIANNVVSVFMEHFEDVLIQFVDYWLFIQIKTRNSDLGPWKLSDTLNESGGLRSLYRSYQSLKDINFSLALFLEGPITKKNLLNSLVESAEYRDPELVRIVSKRLEISESECKSFLAKVTVKPNSPNREVIKAKNIQLLGTVSPQTPAGEIEAVYDQCIDEIARAMSGEPLNEEIAELFDPKDSSSELTARIVRKRLTRERLLSILGNITKGPHPLLKRVIETHLPNPSDLEMKLIAAGAIDPVIIDAKQLRANASIRIAELSSASLFGFGEQLEDIRIRIQTTTNSVIQQYADEENPVRTAWSELLQRFNQEADQIDPNNVFRQDSFLLMGIACQMSDECIIDWGMRIA